MRSYDDVIDVRMAPVTAAGHPDVFVWRGKVYRVRSVIGHWYQRTPWWRQVLDRAEPPGSPERSPQSVSLSSGENEGWPPLQDEVWRVEASAGRTAGSGVYDLIRGHEWRLSRVAD